MGITWTHLESVWNPSGASEVPYSTNQYTDVGFASVLSSGFTTMAVINPPESKLAKRTSVQCGPSIININYFFLILGPPRTQSCLLQVEFPRKWGFYLKNGVS